MASTSVQERIKRLNQLESGPAIKAGHVPHGSVHGRVQMLNMTTNKSSTMTKDKAQLFKAAKLIKKTFSNDSADGDAPFLSSHSKEQKRHTEDNVLPSDNTSSQVSLNDEEEDGELDAAAAMAYWRNRGRKGDAVRKEAREHPSTKQTNSIRGVRTSAPAPKLPAEEQAGSSSSLEANTCPEPSIPQQQQGQQSTVKDRVIFRTPDEDEEVPFDVTAADASSSTNNNARYAMPVSSVKSSESVFSGDSIFSGTSSSHASTLSARAKKFVEKKRRNVAIVTGQGGVDNNADESGSDTGKITAKSILREKACRDRLKKKASSPLATPAPIAVGETVDLHTSKTDDIIQIKADMPFDEPNKKNTSGDSVGVITVEANGDEVKPESIVSSNQLRNFAFASMDKVKANQWDNTSQHTESTNNSSNHSAVIRVTQQDKNNNSEGSLSTEFTNQSEMPITTGNITGSVTSHVSQLTSKESLPSDRSSRYEEQKRKPRPVTEKADKGILNTFGALVEDAGCQFLDSLESSSSCIANALKGINEDANVPFDEEDVAIEVEYVDQANV
jgi:hypothetical protein